MNVLHYMRIIARALDYAKDPDPKHWKTINGSHVHLDKNGNYDGGAGSKFNGRHHYGPGWKEKQSVSKRRSAEEIIYSYEMGPDAKTLPTQVLEERMKKAANYREWNQARGEILQRLKNHVHEYSNKFNLAHGSPEQKAIGEELDRRESVLEDFRKKSTIPTRFMEEAFEHDPQKAEKTYKEKNFWNEDFYPAYEKWREKKKRTASALKNLAEAFRNKPDEEAGENAYPHGATLKFPGGGVMEIFQSKDNKDEFHIIGAFGRVTRRLPGGMPAFLDKAKREGASVKARQPREREDPTPLTREQRRIGRVGRQITRSMVKGRPIGAR